MNFIKSHDLKEKLTHVTQNMESYNSIQKNGIKIRSFTDGMLWKPEAFWISIDYDWERWCHGENFSNIPERIICDVILKKDLKLLKVENIQDVKELSRQLMPDAKPLRNFSGVNDISDMMMMGIYHIEKLKEGKIIKPVEFWSPITENYDGIYFKNSSDMHFETFFNTWDAHSIALFDGKNAILSNPRSGKKLMDKEIKIVQ